MSDSLAVYTYRQIAAIKQVDPEGAAQLRREYSTALKVDGIAEQRIGEQIEDLYNALRLAGKIKP